jgi:hypothetical protein
MTVFFLVVGVLIWTIPATIHGARPHCGVANRGKKRHMISMFFDCDFFVVLKFRFETQFLRWLPPSHAVGVSMAAHLRAFQSGN